MSNPTNDWKKDFLQKRCLDHPTGGPLYSYRMTAAEFEDLEQLLQYRLNAYLKLASLGDVARHITYFPALFVLYSAEWWHRRYDGSGWSWEPIMSGFGVEVGSWTQAQRSECVEKGLQDWRLKLTNSHGLRYLGSIAFQGGLPMQLLATAQGNIGRVLGRVLRLAATGNFEPKDVQSWIESLSSYLPKAYRLTEVYVLLAEVILSVLRLKDAAKLTSAEGAIESLNRFDSNWRNYFPIPIEDNQAQGLIDQLIRDAAEAKISQPAKRISVERRLEFIGEKWQIRSDVILPEYIEANDLANMFATEKPFLTRGLTLRISRNNKFVELGLRKLAGQERYRVERRPLEARNDSAAAEHTATLITSEGLVFNGIVNRGEALSSELPWLMEPWPDSTNVFRFVRQGGGSLSSLEALIAVPESWDVRKDEIGDAVRVGDLAVQKRIVWKVNGNIRIEDTSGQYFKLRCGQAASTEDQLELRGSRVWGTFENPELAFSSTPKLYRVSEAGLGQTVPGSIAWCVSSSKKTLNPLGLVGPVIASWPADGETKWRARLVLLPDNAKIRIEPGDSPSIGKIGFENYALLAAQTDNTEVTLQLEQNGTDSLINVSYLGLGSPPEWIDLKLLWRSNPNEAQVRVPFPAKGCRAFDGNGRQLADGTLIPTRNIIGVRLVGFLGNTYTAEIGLSLHDGNPANSLNSINRIIRANSGESRVEIRLIDYAQEIQRMLAGADGLDATVNFNLKVGGYSTSVRIARYACELEKLLSPPSVELSLGMLEQLTPDDITAISVRALRMDAPGEEPISLLPKLSEGVATGSWTFPLQSLSPGPWLIYPSADSPLIFRPLLWPVLSEDVLQTTELDSSLCLLKILGISDNFLRQEAMSTLVSELAGNFVHSDWQVVEQIAGNLGHLPLSTLDIWRSFARSSEGMSALGIKIGNWPTGFIERFSTELPVMWETISLEVWRNSMDLLSRQCNEWYGVEGGKTVFASHLDRRVQDIASANPALRVLLEIAKAKVTGIITHDIALAQQEFADGLFADQLFEGSDCYLQQLLRNNADAQWPVGFWDEIDKARHNGTVGYLGPSGNKHHDAVINIPILLAVGAVTESSSEWCVDAKSVRRLRAIQTFDSEWFAEAFDLTVARCLSRNTVNIH